MKIKKMVLLPIDLKELLSEVSLSNEEALELIKAIDLNMQDWEFTEEACNYFMKEMDEFNEQH